MSDVPSLPDPRGGTSDTGRILTSPRALRAALDTGRFPDGGPVRVLDVRWRLDRPDGRSAYREGHIPGAQYVDLDRELAAHGAPTDGRHPLPRIGDLQESARRWSIDDGDTVVVYDDVNNLSSARVVALAVRRARRRPPSRRRTRGLDRRGIAARDG